MTSASSFQMLRGSVIVFTGLLSVGFLGRRLELSQWLGIGVTILGLLLVGLADLRGGRGQQHQLSQVITGRWSSPFFGGKKAFFGGAKNVLKIGGHKEQIRSES